MPSAMHTPTSVGHYRQTTYSSTSREEATEVAHTLYHHSDDAQSRAGDLLQPRDEAQRVLWEDEAHRRATGQHALHPRSDRWQSAGRTIYNARDKSALSWRREHGKEPKTPVRSAKSSTSRPTQRAFSASPDQTKAANGKRLHVGVSESLVEALYTGYPSPGSTINPIASPCPSTTPSLTYSEGSDSGEEDTPSMSGDDDCLMTDSPTVYYYEEGLPSLENMEAEIANLNAVILARQEEMDAAHKADLLFMELINVDGCMDVRMDY